MRSEVLTSTPIPERQNPNQYKPAKVIIPIATPGTEGFLLSANYTEVDRKGIKKLTKSLSRKGVNFFLLGTGGENSDLSHRQKKDVIETFAKSIKEDATEKTEDPIDFIVGISANSKYEMTDLATFAKEHGAKALVLTPFAGDVEAEQQMKTVSDATDLPIFLYNNPGFLHPDKGSIPAKKVKEWKNKYNVIGIKDTSGDEDLFKEYLEIQNKSDSEFFVLQGWPDSLRTSKLDKDDGAWGIVAAPSNFMDIDTIDSAAIGDPKAMTEVAEETDRLLKNKNGFKMGVKEKLVKQGVIKETVVFGANTDEFTWDIFDLPTQEK